jgi:hypothetical protein
VVPKLMPALLVVQRAKVELREALLAALAVL